MKTETTRISKYLKIFAGGALLYLAAVLPFLIYHGGYFFYYGDYNVQQVPFLILLHRSVREGRLFWNPILIWAPQQEARLRSTCSEVLFSGCPSRSPKGRFPM